MDDTRLSVQHMAVTMYSERIAIETKAGRAAMFRTNPDARALYFKGVNDALTCIRTWVNDDNIRDSTVKRLLVELGKQTRDSGPAN